MSLLLSRKLANPIYFPGFPAIRRKRLLHARRVGRDIEPHVAHQNGSAFEVFLIEKLAAIAGKVAHHGRQAKSSVVNVDQVDAPLARCGVVEPERLRLDVEFLVGAGHFELFEVRIAVEEFMVVRDAVVFDPEIGVIETIGKATDMSLPVADEEVEVVRTVALRQVSRIVGGLSVQRDSKHCAENQQCEDR